MTKLGFSGDEDENDALRISTLFSRKRRRFAGRVETGGGEQPRMSSEEEDSYRSSEDSLYSEDEDVEIVDEDEGRQIVEQRPDLEQGTSSGSEGNRAASVSVTLTDPEVLDCSICLEALSVPVYQCENGHIACSSCCIRLHNKCPSCSWPIGYNRCRAIEKVLESVKVSCQNTAYGCKETLSYCKKLEHEETCTYAPCSCPHTNCNFHGSSKQLSLHLKSEHSNSLKHFRYNCLFRVHLEFDAANKLQVLEEANEGSLFILSSSVQQLGHAVTVCSIGPRSSRGVHAYDLRARKGSCWLRLQSFTKNIKEVADLPSPSVGFLLIPKASNGCYEQPKLELCIMGSNGNGNANANADIRPAKRSK